MVDNLSFVTNFTSVIDETEKTKKKKYRHFLVENYYLSFSAASVSHGGGFSLWHISFPRRNGGSGERSEPKGALMQQPLSMRSEQCQ